MLERIQSTLILLLLLCYWTIKMSPTHPTEKHGNKLFIVHIAIPVYIGLAGHLLNVVLATITQLMWQYLHVQLSPRCGIGINDKVHVTMSVNISMSCILLFALSSPNVTHLAIDILRFSFRRITHDQNNYSYCIPLALSVDTIGIFENCKILQDTSVSARERISPKVCITWR